MTPQIAIEILKRYKNHWFGDMLHDNGFVTVQQIIDMLTAQPEITDEQAIDHLQATGWMQEHDRQMYEMGIKEQLADDSGSYDGLIPQTNIDEWCTDCKEYDREKHCCPRFNRVIRETLREVQSSDLIRRQDAIDAVCMDGCGLCKEAIEQIGGGND